MNVQIPVKWVQELLALCGPEDHELRERVMVSITAMDEQAARAVARPEHDEAVNEVMELVGSAMDSSMKAGELLLDSHEKFNAQFASAKSLKNLVESKLRAVLVNVHAPQAQADARDAKDFTRGFNAATCVALQVLRGFGDTDSAPWREILNAAGRAEVENYAKNIEPENWELCGFAHIAAIAAEKGE